MELQTPMDLRNILDDRFSGCIQVRQAGRTLFEAAVGLADKSNAVPNTRDTRFATASAGKAFVAAAILSLVEEGRLRLSDTLGSLLELDLKAIDPAITVEQLLTHTSGIPDYFDETVMDDYAELWQSVPNYRIRGGRDLLPLFIDNPMAYPPGERFQYNNTGYTVLGLILEAVSGQSFDECLRQRVFDPLRMTRTGYFELDRLPDGCAQHYIYDPVRGEYYTNIYSIDAKGSGAGGAYVTVGDIERFWDGLLGCRLFSPALTEAMLSIHSTSPDEDSYGFGIWLGNSRPDGSLPYITGSDPGVSFISSFDRRTGRLITIVSNTADNVWALHRSIRAVLDEAGPASV